MRTIQVDVKTLKQSYPEQYDKEYQKYCTSQWDFPMEDEWYKDGLNETSWLDVDAVYWSVGYCQSDYAYFTGHVDLIAFLNEYDIENEYFVLREAMELEDCADRLYIGGSSYRNGHAVFDEIEWRGTDDGYFQEEDVVLRYHGVEHRSILEGMNYQEYYDICMELSGDLYTWVKEVCEQRMNQLYDEIRADIDHQMSEESFEEWAESMDEKFDVEVEAQAA